jgi:hypothetical protein
MKQKLDEVSEAVGDMRLETRKYISLKFVCTSDTFSSKGISCISSVFALIRLLLQRKKGDSFHLTSKCVQLLLVFFIFCEQEGSKGCNEE